MDIIALTNSFLEALNHRTFERCDEIIAQVEVAARTDPLLEPHHLYFSATLLDEREHDWPAAVKIYDQVLAHPLLQNSLRCNVLQSFSLSLWKQGLWNAALHKSDSALHLAQELEDLEMQHKILGGQAIIYYEGFTNSDFGASVLSKAEERCIQALACLNDDDKQTRKAASVWNTLGNVYGAMNRTEDAINCYQTLLQIGQHAENKFFIAHASDNLGVCYQYIDEWSKALAAHEKALELFENDYERLRVFANIGYLCQAQNLYAQALIHYDQAIDLIEDVRAGLQSEDARTNYATTVADVYANAILTCNAASKDKKIDPTEQFVYRAKAFDYTELARSRSFLDLLAGRMHDLESAYRARPMTLSDVQAVLPEDALLLAYFTTGVIESPDAKTKKGSYTRHRFPPGRILTFAVTKDEIRIYTSALSPNVIYPKNRDDFVQTHFLKDIVRQTLYKHLVEPFDALMQNRRVLYIIPHGPLHYLPFQAMLMQDEQTLLNADGPQIVYAPSATVLLRDTPLAEDGQTDEFFAKSAVVEHHDDPTALRSSLAVGYNGNGAARLLLAENEASAIATLTNGDALVGSQQKKQLVFQRAAHYRHLFFSCHGVFDALNPLHSSLFIGEDETLSAIEVLRYLEINRCQLVFLSACQSGLSQVQRGDELFGLPRAFLLAGASALVVTQWRVDERSTRIFIENFCHWLLDGLEYAEALRQAQLYLQHLTKDEVLQILASYGANLETESERYLDDLLARSDPDERVFAEPFHWAPFILICDNRLR